jgi:hypothetical protein
MNHQAQTLNNCGPASVAIALSYYGHQVTQHAVKTQFWRAPGACHIPWYVPRYGLMARAYRFPPLTRERKLFPIRGLLANGIPVIVLQRLSPGSSIGHFRVIHGYDDAIGEFIADDPLLGRGYRIPYETFGHLLSYPQPILFPLYPPGTDALVQSLMGEAKAYAWTDEEGSSCAELRGE